MIGRVINGWKKNDSVFIRYTFAKSFVQGQQLGWCNSDVIDNGEVFPYLYKLCHMRYALRSLFVTGSILRPPLLETEIEKHISKPHMWGGDDLVLDSVISGGWLDEYKNVHLFVFNIKDEKGNCRLSLRASEYGVTDTVPASLLSYSPSLDKENDTLTLSIPLSGLDALHITL